MSDFALSSIVAVSAAAWIYNKFYSRTGGNQRQALMTAGLTGVGIFIVFMTLLAVFL